MAKKPWWCYREQAKKAAKAARQLEEQQQQQQQQPKGILSPAVAQIFARHPIHDNILRRLSAASLARMACVSRDVRAATLDFTARAYNLDRRLARFFGDPAAFRALMARTRVVISGSFALQFLDRSFYPESDLDLYVPMPWRLYLGRFLLENGYRFIPYRRPRQHPDFESAANERRVVASRGRYRTMKGIAGVFTFKKTSCDGQELKVQVMVAVRSTLEVILNYHSSMS